MKMVIVWADNTYETIAREIEDGLVVDLWDRPDRPRAKSLMFYKPKPRAIRNKK